MCHVSHRYTTLGVNGPPIESLGYGLFRAEGLLAHVAGVCVPTSGKSPHTHVMSFKIRDLIVVPPRKLLRSLGKNSIPAISSFISYLLSITKPEILQSLGALAFLYPGIHARGEEGYLSSRMASGRNHFNYCYTLSLRAYTFRT